MAEKEAVGKTSNEAIISIPSEAVEIKDGAYKGSDAKGVRFLGKNVQKIGENAFSGCKRLETVELPNSVTTIFFGAFSNCTGLKYIYIPANVVYIASDAFAGCSKSLIIVGEENTEAQEHAKKQGFIFRTSLDEMPNARKNPQESSSSLKIDMAKKETVEKTSNEGIISIPREAVEIKNGAYKGSDIKGVRFLGKNVQKIGENAFSGCKRLETVELPNSVTTIFFGAFSNCTGLKYIYIPANVVYIASDAFAGCSKSLIIVGEENTEAQEHAKKQGFIFRTSLDEIKKARKNSQESSSSLKIDTFYVFGQSITCSSALRTYVELEDYYNESKASLLTKLRNNITYDVRDGKKITALRNDLINSMQDLPKKTVERLAKKGVTVDEKDVKAYVIAPHATLLEALKLAIDTFNLLDEEGSGKIERQSRKILREARNKITGTGSIYVYSHSAVGLIASLEDDIVRQQQASAASAEGEAKLDAYVKAVVEEENKKLKPIIDKLKEAIDKLIPQYIHGLRTAELNHLVSAGIVNSGIDKGIDIGKARELAKKVDFSESKSSLEMSIALSLSLCPYNPTFVRQVIEKGITCVGLKSLIVHLGMDKDIEAMKSAELEKKRSYYEEVGNKRNEHLVKFLRGLPLTIENIESYVDEWLDKQLNEEDWEICQRYAVAPFGTKWDTYRGERPHDGEDIGLCVCTAKPEVRGWLIRRVRHIIEYSKEKDVIYQEALAEMRLGKKENLLKAQEILRKLRPYYRGQNDKVDRLLTEIEYQLKAIEKKKKILKILGIVAGAIVGIALPFIITAIVFACIEAGSNYLEFDSYYDHREGVRVWDQIQDKEHVVVPEYYKGKVVNGIRAKAFEDSTSRSISLPKTIKYFEKDKYDLFYWGNISEIYIEDLRSLIYAIDISDCEILRGQKLYVNGELLSGKLTLPSDITRLPAGTFCGYQYITSVDLTYLEIIEEYTFAYSGISGEIIVPSTVKEIHTDAFGGCGGLTRVVVTENTKVERSAFHYFTLSFEPKREIEIDVTVNEAEYKYIPYNTTKLTVLSGEIDEADIEGLEDLEELYIGEHVTEITDEALALLEGVTIVVDEANAFVTID